MVIKTRTVVAEGVKGMVAKGYEGILRVREMFCLLIGVVVTWVYTFVKT